VLHPDVELRLIDQEIGYGLFATRFIPRGTLTWVMCSPEQVFQPRDVVRLGPAYHAYLDKYAYANAAGDRILCCDLGRFMNHSCDSSTLTLPGAELEVAVRDIQPGEQVTDDYGTLNLDQELVCLCGSPHCRGIVRGDDPARNQASWEVRVREALPFVACVAQPLAAFVHNGLNGHLAAQLGLQPEPQLTPGH